MKHLLTPKLDYVFKRLFAEDREILLDLVNAVLNFPESHRIESLEVKNPIILPEQITDKYIILDILAIDRTGHRYDIEMQTQKYQYYPERTVYYLCRMYANQLEAGEQYESLKPVLGIHFLDYRQFPDDKDFHYCFQLRDVRHPNLRLTDHLSMYMFELPKLKNGDQSEQRKEKMFEWLHFLNHAQEEGEQTMRTQYTNPVIHKAFKVLERLSADDETRYQAEARERAIRNKVSELSAARKEGREEGREEGRIIGQIGLLQEMLKHIVCSEEELVQKSMEELNKMLQELKAELYSARS